MNLLPLTKRFPAREGTFKIFYHLDCLLHNSYMEGHPERPARLKAILSGCQDAIPEGTPVSFMVPTPARWQDLEQVHLRDYLEAMESCILSGKSSFMTPDTYICPDSICSILAASGLSIALSSELLSGGAGFALTRPPGHHAGKSNAEGFCFVNHCALCIEKIRCREPRARFLIVDFDVHYGNGTSLIYQEDPNVYFFSIHGPPAHIYPYSGYETEKGTGVGMGFTKNVTLPEDTSGKIWLNALSDSLSEILPSFLPDFLLVSAGFDAHKEDPFSIMKVEDEHYLKAIATLCEASQNYCSGNLALFLEGGYSLGVLRRLVPKIIVELSTSFIR